LPNDCQDVATRQGEATYYDFADGTGNCSFNASTDLMIGAMNHTDYADSAACGACVRIDGPLGGVDVRIVDRCPECPAGDIDLSPEAFGEIAEIASGRVPISWRWIDCSVDGPIRYRFKEGSNEWWTAVQIRNHRRPIAHLEYRTASGDYATVARESYNYFVAADGMGPGPYAFIVSDVYGAELQDENIAHTEGSEVDGAGQFPACPSP